jgi:hypothetical protein
MKGGTSAGDYQSGAKRYCKALYFREPFIFAIGGQIANIKGAKIPKFQPLEISLNCPETSSIRLTICSRMSHKHSHLIGNWEAVQ